MDTQEEKAYKTLVGMRRFCKGLLAYVMLVRGVLPHFFHFQTPDTPYQAQMFELASLSVVLLAIAIVAHHKIMSMVACFYFSLVIAFYGCLEIGSPLLTMIYFGFSGFGIVLGMIVHRT